MIKEEECSIIPNVMHMIILSAWHHHTTPPAILDYYGFFNITLHAYYWT